jgi:hypothetical protein
MDKCYNGIPCASEFIGDVRNTTSIYGVLVEDIMILVMMLRNANSSLRFDSCETFF